MDVRHVFIGGLHRSGTSPLHRMLASHPLITGFAGTGVPEDEGQHLQTLIPPARAHGGAGSFGRDPASHLTETDSRCNEDGAAALLRSWGPLWDAEARIRLEKSPPNIVRFRFLEGLFPGCLSVAVIRHPLAVALATEKWTRFTSLSRLVEHWCLVHERFQEDLPHLSRLLVIRYEDLIERTESVAERLARELDVPPSFDTASIRGDGNERYAEMWRSRRRAPTTRRACQRMLDDYTDRVEQLGYRLGEVDAQPLAGPWPATF